MLYILDASGFLFRAYYSMPKILDKEGKESGAIFGFYRMILKLLQKRPDNFIMVFDPGKKTKRMEDFKEYKANRPKIDDSFKQQIPKIIDIAKQVGFNVEIIQEYEADDVIASIVNNYDKESYVISSDKDLKQLITDKIKFIDPKNMEVIDKNLFLNEYGFSPKGMVLYLSLLGDSSDNIPGIKGIGKKTAQEIVSKYETYEDLIKNLDNLKGNLKGKIIENKELLERNIKLVSLMEIGNYLSSDIEKKSDIKNLNLDELENILVNSYGFKSFSSIIFKFKKEIQQPIQQSLF